MRQILSLLVVVLFVSPVVAQPLADKVPANSLIYFGWRGSDDLGPGYAESHTKAILDQSNLPAVFSPTQAQRLMKSSIEEERR